jgi:UDP-3-O-[3-hydroxymyristoyl] glucosamine N-acyltransferase
MPEFTLAKLAAMLGGTLAGDGDKVVRGVSSLEAAGEDDVSFLANTRYEKQVETTRAAAVIVSGDYAGPGNSLIRCKDPYFAFREAMVAFHGFRKHPFSGVDARANVDASAKLGENVAVAAFATICAGSTLGAGTAIYPGVFVGPSCRVGKDCILYPNVTLYDGSVLGDRVTIHAGTSIGEDGFGYATHNGRHEKIPQAGYVEIEDDVEIGACCAIDRATMGPTVIGAGTKMSNSVVIGHGTKMGKHCLLVAQAGIAGSVTLGNYVVLAGQVGIVGHVQVGDGVRVGAQSGVTNDVPAGQEVLGSPAVPMALARRSLANLTNLPRMRTHIRQVLKQLQAIQKRLGTGSPADSGEDASE